MAETGLRVLVGPANDVSVGEVKEGPAAAVMRDVAPGKQMLDLTLPKGNKGDTGKVPTVRVGTVVTAPPKIVEGPAGDKGDKGDPGGFVSGTPLSSANLDTILAPGLYRQDNGPAASMANNYPVSSTGSLMVTNTYADNSRVTQIFHPLGGTNFARNFYVRQLFSGAWSPWRAYNSTRVDQTAGRAIYQWDDLNNREQLIYGDTGWRDITAMLNGTVYDNVPSASNYVQIRRNGYTVEMRARILVKTAPSSTVILSGFPLEFRSDDTSSQFVPAVSVGATPANDQMTPVRAAARSGGDWDSRSLLPVGLTLHAALSWTTLRTWPTSLPGTVSGAVPNA